jgi:RNA polymerase sigma factor (sigma-70 family)
VSPTRSRTVGYSRAICFESVINKTLLAVVFKAVRGLKRDRMLEEIERVYRTGYPTYLRVASAITDSPDLGHDAVQEAFVRAIRGLGSYRARGSLEGWIWRIVVNAARDRRVAAVEPLVRDVPIEPGQEERGVLRQAIARLPERQRLAVFLRYFADLDQSSIAQVLAVRPGTVAATLHAARETLRQSLEEVESWER